MVLDSRKQRDLLLQIVQSMPVSGDYKSVSEFVKEVDALCSAIAGAEIKPE